MWNPTSTSFKIQHLFPQCTYCLPINMEGFMEESFYFIAKYFPRVLNLMDSHKRKLCSIVVDKKQMNMSNSILLPASASITIS